MEKIKAIQTSYKVYKFRSRLEARWAVFFDALGIDWEYEPEGFDLDGVYYLPDFYIPSVDAWIEVKPKTGTRKEVLETLIKMVSHGPARKNGAWGVFGDPLDHHWMLPAGEGKEEWMENTSICFEKFEETVMALPTFSLSKNVPEIKDIRPNIGNYKEKCLARSARFEHGESPW